MQGNNDGNFEFIRIINRDLYDKLHSAEMFARIDFNRCCQDCRSALELFINSVLYKHGLTPRYGRIELFKKIEALQDEDVLRSIGFLAPSESINDKSLLADLGEVTYDREDGTEGTIDYWDYMRRFGNMGAHVEHGNADPSQTYRNCVICLRGFYDALKSYYKRQISGSLGGYDEYAMPIAEFCVYDSYVPGDQARSKCQREFLAYTKDENGDRTFYAILRLYNKQSASDTFMLRNQKCFTEAAKMSESNVPEGMARLRELVPKDSRNSSFYIISYMFNQEPHRLTDSLLSSMELTQRIRLCCKIINCLENLHTSPIPIYHRMLNYECVYVCKIRNKWTPYIVKFDYAKIVSDAPLGTVFNDAVKAGDKLKEVKLNKYLPPEWENLTQSAGDKDWSKVDIYSLGMLCTDIIMGKIESRIVGIDELEDMGLSDELLDTLDIMRAEDPKERWAIDDIKDIFDDEYRRLKKAR